MIWVKIPGIRHGMAYTKESMTKGQFAYLAGHAVAADMPLGTPGFSSAGSKILRLAKAPAMYGRAGWLSGVLNTVVTTSILVSGAKAAPVGVYPVNKLIYQPEDDELDLQTIASGAGCIYYESGEFETDQWEDATNVMSSAVFGDLLFLNGNARLTRDAGWMLSGYVVATFMSRLAAPDSGAGVIAPTFGNFTPTLSADGLRSAGPIWYRLTVQG